MTSEYKNLRPFTTDQSREEAVKNGRAGGIASGAARRRKKELREFLNDFLDQESIPPVRAWMIEHGVDPDDCCNLMALLLAVFSKAMTGDVEAAHTILEWAGLLPMQDAREAVMEAQYENVMSSSAINHDRIGDYDIEDIVIYKVKDSSIDDVME